MGHKLDGYLSDHGFQFDGEMGPLYVAPLPFQGMRIVVPYTEDGSLLSKIHTVTFRSIPMGANVNGVRFLWFNLELEEPAK